MVIDEEQKKVFASSDHLFSTINKGEEGKKGLDLFSIANIGEEQKKKVLTSSDGLFIFLKLLAGHIRPANCMLLTPDLNTCW